MFKKQILRHHSHQFWWLTSEVC